MARLADILLRATLRLTLYSGNGSDSDIPRRLDYGLRAVIYLSVQTRRNAAQ